MSDRSPVDLVSLYFGEDHKINEYIVLRQPSIQEIVDYGELDFWRMVHLFCANTTSMRLMLWKNGIDWNKISDYELFVYLLPVFKPEFTRLILVGLDLSRFIPITIEKEAAAGDQPVSEVVLISIDNPSVMIDEDIYKQMMFFFRTVFNYHPKNEFAKGKFTKQLMIDDDELNIFNAERMQKISPTYDSFLMPLLSFALNHPGFKYRKDELRNLKFFEFMDSILRIQSTESSLALMTGMYSGMVNFKDNPELKKELVLTRSTYDGIKY